MRTVEIDGGSACLREGKEIKVRHRRLVESAAVGASTALAKLPSDQDELESLSLDQLGLTKDEAQALFDLQDATIVATLDSWTLTDPLPTLDTIGDMDSDVYEQLAKVTRDIGASVVNGVDFEPGDPRDPEFQASPTTPSGDSAVDSRAEQAPQSIEPQPTSGPSTSSVSPSQD